MTSEDASTTLAIVRTYVDSRRPVPPHLAAALEVLAGQSDLPPNLRADAAILLELEAVS
jgi:hypothetical protein